MAVGYDEALRDQLRANLGAHEVLELPLEGRRRAAVAVVVVDSDAAEHGEDPTPSLPGGRIDHIPGDHVPGELTGSVAGTAGGPAVLLTRRAAKLNSHGGQWALPGGRVDVGEGPLDAARRELHEELGLDLPEAALLGQLDDYPTRSGYVMSPFVFWGGADPALVPNPHEVASVHRISLRELCRPDSPRFLQIPESERPVVQLPIGKDLIHAPTGAVLYQFRRVAVEGVLERVAHLEQPLFAWR
ncbi:MAG: NUDIX domain-containing protein [Acidimicrobiia bacterium]|nr:NUDIX domain-containing protein [Acidimicrobiia bacterium]